MRSSNSMPGWSSRNLSMAGGRMWVATDEKVPTTMEPTCAPATSNTRSRRRRWSSQIASTNGMTCSPSEVRRAPRRPRSSSWMPHSRSRSATMRLTPDWL